MKNILNLLPGSFFIMVILLSCKKDENKIFFEGGTAPVLTASSTSAMVLDSVFKNSQAIKFDWTNPDYKFTTGISSQDVTYVLQVDTSGANFTNPGLQEISIAKELGVTYTIKELNAILTKLNLLENIPHDVEFRIKATLVNNTVPRYSNVIKITITPYLDVAVPIPPTGELYITGSGVASDWTNNPPESQKFTKVSKTEYNITIALIAGKEFKFLSTLNQWQPQYGRATATTNPSGGDMGYNMGLPGQSDPPSFTTLGTGTYKINVNFKTGKFAVTQ
jgi:hypothetical protein